MSGVQVPPGLPISKLIEELIIFLKKVILSILLFISFGCSSSGFKHENESHQEPALIQSPFVLPTSKIQKEMVIAIRNEMIRLDGEGLIPRKNRPESFQKTTNKISKEALLNKTEFDFYRTFSKLNATYPNLHAHIHFNDHLNSEITESKNQKMADANINLSVEVVKPTKTRTVVQHIFENEELNKKWEGAELTAINGIPLKKWQDENFIFCKWALRSICDRTLEENLLQGILFWKGGPLTYRIKKGNEKINFIVQFLK